MNGSGFDTIMNQKKKHDMAMMSRAGTSLTLRVVVAAYIIYLAWKVLSAVFRGGSPIPLWCAWLIFSVFLAAAVLFCLFSLKQYLKTRKAAEIRSPEQSDGEDSNTNSDSERR